MIVDDFKDEAEVKLRTCIKNIVSYCNRRGGWNISGWMRRGHQIDPVDTPDGGNIGLHKHMSIAAKITRGCSGKPLIEWLRKHLAMKLLSESSIDNIVGRY